MKDAIAFAKRCKVDAIATTVQQLIEEKATAEWRIDEVRIAANDNVTMKWMATFLECMAGRI